MDGSMNVAGADGLRVVRNIGLSFLVHEGFLAKSGVHCKY